MTAFGAMTWNVENLFRPPQDATDEEREHYRKKLGLLAGVIGGLDPDAVALQEVGGEEELADLQDALGGPCASGSPRRASRWTSSPATSSPSSSPSAVPAGGPASHVDFRERLPSVTDDPAEREDDVAPDHAPVIARFEL